MIAFTFPGQGSQSAGMGGPWACHPSWELVHEMSEASDCDVGALLLEADAHELRATHRSQLATFAASIVVLDALERLGVEPAVVAGHSLGEYTALVAAGSISLDEGARLVAERGLAMHEAATERPGTMAAVVGAELQLVEVACARVDGDAWVANDNAPGQVVIAGSPEGVAEAGDRAKQAGGRKVLPLAVGGAFHTPYMAPARERLRKAVAATELRSPDVPVVANVDAGVHLDPTEWPGLLGAQLCGRVQWRTTLHTLAEMGVTTLVEVGPGSALTGMARRTVPGIPAVPVSKPDDLDRLVDHLAAGGGGNLEPPTGEHLHATERLVVSPAVGTFTPAAVAPGDALAVGDQVGTVGGTPVYSPFAGVLMGVLALPGERVTPSRPVAWLRSAGS